MLCRTRRKVAESNSTTTSVTAPKLPLIPSLHRKIRAKLAFQTE